MTLRRKTLIVIGLTFIGLIVIQFFCARLILWRSLAHLEEEVASRDLGRVRSALQNEITSLDAMAGELSGWGEISSFLGTGTAGRLVEQTNLSPSNLARLGLDFILVFDRDGKMVFGRGVDAETNREAALPDGLRLILAPGHPIFRQPSIRGSRTGFLLLPDDPTAIAARPISGSAGVIAGTLILGRSLNSSVIERLGRIALVRLELSKYQEIKNMERLRRLGKSDRDFLMEPRGDEALAGYVLFDDLQGHPAFFLRVLMDRELYVQGRVSILYFVIALIVTSLVYVVVILLLLERLVLAPLAILIADISRIGLNGKLGKLVPVVGRDELSQLAQAINSSLAQLGEYQIELEESQERYRKLAHEFRTAHQQLLDIIEFLPDPTFVIDRDKKVIAWNQAIENMTGLPKEEIIGKGDYSYAVPFYGHPRPLLIDLIGTDDPEAEKQYKYFARKGNTVYAEIYVPRVFKGRGAFLWISASPLFDTKENLVGAIETIRDVTERKKAEEQLKYLSMHDPLTGLYNRNYFEEEMRRMEAEERAEMGLVLCDIDGLKLVNDTLGHDMGDRLLVLAAKVIKSAIRGKGTVARIGGDEFAILVRGYDDLALERVCHRISEATSDYNRDHPGLPLSISVGFAAVADGAASISELFKEADNNVYREKLHRRQSTRSAIVQALMKALEARDFMTEGHADRLQNLGAALAMAVGLSERRVDDLRLLAQFHDIGKVGIPDRILLKNGLLTADEVGEMQRHSEIGYRIAQSASDLVPIADWILKHHEWWNGQGYPFGLKGEEIPLECRIIAIADAYDAMISDRPYRKALTSDQAEREIARGAGTRFDPALVEKFLQVLAAQKPLISGTA